ncbi:MAG: hypothetical protein AAFX06_07210 [Planctomycetota bacterium]
MRSQLALLGLIALIAIPCSKSLAEESGPEFRYDLSQTLNFEATKTPARPGVSPDGTMRAVVDFKMIRVLSVADGKLLHEFATPNRAMSPTFSADQKRLVYADCTGNLACKSTVYLRDLETGKEATVGDCYGITLRFAFSGDGKRLAMVSMYGPILALIPKQRFGKQVAGEIAIFDLENNRELFHTAYQGPGNAVENEAARQLLPIEITLNDDGSTLLVAAPSGVVHVLDIDQPHKRFSATVPKKFPKE